MGERYTEGGFWDQDRAQREEGIVKSPSPEDPALGLAPSPALPPPPAVPQDRIGDRGDLVLERDQLRAENSLLLAQLEERAAPLPGTPMSPYMDAYQELLNAVESKHPGESRHMTALRYIREREANGDPRTGQILERALTALAPTDPNPNPPGGENAKS